MAKVRAQWRGFISAIVLACLTAGVAMWAMGWLDRDLRTISGDILSAARSALGVEDQPYRQVPSQADIYQSPAGSETAEPISLTFWGDSAERTLANHRNQGAVVAKPTVVDGDTVQLEGVTYRLWGVDAPELAQICPGGFAVSWRCGQDAKAALEAFLGNQQIACYPKGEDAERRNLALCFAGTLDIGRAQTREGWAMAVRTVTPTYVSTEINAKHRRLGMWRAGDPEAPWEWRQRNRRR